MSIKQVAVDLEQLKRQHPRAVDAFERRYNASAEDPTIDGELGIWMEAWAAALHPDSSSVGVTPIGWATHHDAPMLFPTREEAAQYCDDDEVPISLVSGPDVSTLVIEEIAQQWDGCRYDSVGEIIEIGAAIRAAGRRLLGDAAR